jgi:hypothetical protein
MVEIRKNDPVDGAWGVGTRAPPFVLSPNRLRADDTPVDVRKEK